MTAIISFSEETSREIAALAEAEHATVDQWLNRYVIDIHRAVADCGGIDALEAANASRRETAATSEPTTTEATQEEA